MASRPPPPPASAPPQSTAHGAPLLPQPLDLQLQQQPQQLHVHVPPLPSPNTTAAAAALFRVNQLPMAVLSPSPTGPFSFDKADVQRSGRSHRALATIDEHAQHEPADARCNDAARREEDAAGEAYTAAVQHQQHQQQQENDRRAKSRSVFTDAAPPLLPLSLYATPGGRPASSAENAMLPPELPMSPPSGDVRKRNVGVPKFLRFLFQMLEYEDRSVICWSHKGTAFQIREPEELARNILPKYFKHNKVSSFQRQLNYFGFKKWTKTQTNICTFSHPFFIRGEKEKMRLIKRKERAARAAADDAKADAISAAAAEILAGDDDSHPQQQPRDEPVASTRPSAKRPRTASSSASVAGRSPRGDGRVKGTTPRAKKEPAARRAQSTVAARKRGKTAGLASLEASPPSMGKMTLPAISPSSSSSSTWGSSASTAGARGLGAAGDDGPIGADAFGRFPRDAAAPSNGSASAYSMVDAAPVMPIHASLLLSHQQAQAQQQQQQQQQPSLARRLSGGVYDSMSMSDFVNADWSPPQPSAEDAAACPSTGKDSMMMLSAFKYGDSSSISAAIGLQPSAFDMMEAQGHVFSGQSQAAAHAGGSAASSGSKDYLDMLLESATMDEQLSVAAATASDVASWDASYALGVTDAT
ncbi:hypothetical protein ATCC90586_001354 [Pythium insidiosum]|nr:hypothetical protein ATCC90586_001354 [Pythium insidiosum]